MKKLVSSYALLLLPLFLFGQSERMIVPSDLKQQTIVTEPITLRKGYFRPGIALSYTVVDKYFNDSGKKRYFMESNYGSDYFSLFMLEYGLTDKLQLEMATRYWSRVQVSEYSMRWPEYDTSGVSNNNNRGQGIGDSYLGVKYQIIPELENKPSLSGEFTVTLPTGRKNPVKVESDSKYDLPTGNGCFAFDLVLRSKLIRYPWSFGLYAGYTFNFPGTKLIYPTDEKETEFKDGNLFNMGAGVNLHLNDWIVMSNDLTFTASGKGTIEDINETEIDPSQAFSYEIRMVFQIRRFRLGEGVRIPLFGKNAGADPNYNLVFGYTF